MSDELTEQEILALEKQLQSTNPPNTDEKYNVHIFLNKVATAEDTTKVGFLTDIEVGVPKHPTRALKDFALVCEKVIGNDYYKDFFNAQAEIITSTSLSRDGFLVKQASTTTRQIADITKTKKENKGWFKKNDKSKEEPLQT